MIADLKHRRNGEIDLCEFYWQVCILINEKKFQNSLDSASPLGNIFSVNKIFYIFSVNNIFFFSGVKRYFSCIRK